jgi:hypothetical protein
MTADPPEDPLLPAVQATLGQSGILDWRAWHHPGRCGAVAVRSVFGEACATVLESAGYEVTREAGWLTVRAAAEKLSA